MALCTRCGRQAEPGAEFCQACAGNSAAEAADQHLTAPAMAAADYLRPFAAAGTGPALLRETQGPEYWNDPGADRVLAYPEPARAATPPPDEPPEEAPPGDDPIYDRWFDSPGEDAQYQGPAVGPPDDAFNSGSGPQGMPQPYGHADTSYDEADQRYQTPDAPYGQPGAPAFPSYAAGPQRYPPAADWYESPGDGYPAYAGDEADYYEAGQTHEASAGYPASYGPWGTAAPQDLAGVDPAEYQDPPPYPSTGFGGRGAGLSDSARPAGRGLGAGARRLFRRHAGPEAEPYGGEQLSAAGLPGQPYAAAPQVPAGGPALAMAAAQADRVGPVSAGTGPADAQFAYTDDPMLAADSDADFEPVRTASRRPRQGRWIAFVGAAIVLIIASAGAAILLAHHAPPARHPVSSRTPASTRAPAPRPTTRPLVTVAPAAAGARQASAVQAFLTRYFTAINKHNFAAYQALFIASQRGDLSAAAFARGYGSSRDSQATLRSISVPAAGKLVATVSFVSHQQPADSATHSSCTSWTISLFLIKQASTYLIHTPPAGYGATAAACP
jgi:hypothetical protein